MSIKTPRLACRAIIVENDRLLLVNAYPDGKSDLWCAPGGGVEAGQSLPQNLAREVFEETGLEIKVRGLLGVSEFHNPNNGFHQVELFFSASIQSGELNDDWTDPEAIVTKRRFFTEDALKEIRFKPDILSKFAFHPSPIAHYDPLEQQIM